MYHTAFKLRRVHCECVHTSGSLSKLRMPIRSETLLARSCDTRLTSQESQESSGSQAVSRCPQDSRKMEIRPFFYKEWQARDFPKNFGRKNRFFSLLHSSGRATAARGRQEGGHCQQEGRPSPHLRWFKICELKLRSTSMEAATGAAAGAAPAA